MRLRLGEVVSVQTDGTVTVTLDGQTVAGLYCVDGARFLAGGGVWIFESGPGQALILGGAGDGPGSDPAGTIIMGGWATAPIGYLLLDGSQVVGGAITYPNIASIYPSWVDTNDLWLPDANNRVPLGDNTGEVGVINGTMSKTIASANLPTHNHGLNNHTHGLNNHTHSTPNHSHDAQLQHVAWGSRTTSSGATKVVVAEENIGGAVQWDGTGIRQSAASGSGTSGGNTGNTAGSTANTTNGGFANTALDITPANITVRYAVKW